MSYILDALRRAQAERGRGSVPGLHTPAASVPQPAQQAPRSGGHRGAWPIAAVAVVAAGALAWLQFFPRTPSQEPVVVAKAPEPATSTSTSTASIPAPAPAAAPASVAAPAPAASTMPAPEPRPAPVFVDVTPPPPPPAPPVPAAKRVEPAKPARQDAAKPPLPTQQEPAAAPVTAPAPAPAAAAVAGPVYTMANLPPAVREQLPNLQLAGITYSSNPKYRMVIVNGQVLHEGESAGPGLVLERIENARTIWAFRGYRYALP